MFLRLLARLNLPRPRRLRRRRRTIQRLSASGNSHIYATWLTIAVTLDFLLLVLFSSCTKDLLNCSLSGKFGGFFFATINFPYFLDCLVCGEVCTQKSTYMPSTTTRFWYYLYWLGRIGWLFFHRIETWWWCWRKTIAFNWLYRNALRASNGRGLSSRRLVAGCPRVE